MKKNKKICFVTSGHLSSNPRLIKEVAAAVTAGYSAVVIFNQYLPAWQVLDEPIKNRFTQVRWIAIDWTGQGISSFLLKLISGFAQKTSRFLFFSGRLGIVRNLAANRNYYIQLFLAKKEKADLYIGHTLATLPVIVHAARAVNALCGFDAEDFHRNENTDHEGSLEYGLAKSIEDTFIPQVHYLSTASTLISKAYSNLYPNQEPTTINNVFSVRFASRPSDNEGTLRLFWFSQTIGKGRGIEEVISAMSRLKMKSISLTLLGNCRHEHFAYWNKLVLESGLPPGRIRILRPVEEKEIFSLAAQHHIGLALEQQVPFNRNICLTNKVFTYLLSGLAVIATETDAQKDFFRSYPGVGKTYPIGDIDRLTEILEEMINNPGQLSCMRARAFETAQSDLNWELEEQKFLELIESVIH